MGTSRLERLAPLTGVLFAVIMVVGFLVVGDTPDTDATPAEIIDHYDDEGMIYFGVIALLLAAVALLFFAGALRRHLASVGPEWLASVVLAGAAVFAAGLGLFLSSQISLVDAADKQQEAAVQALNIIDNSNFGPAVVGLTIMYLATAWHVLGSRSLPVWIGWLSLLLGILALLGPLGFIAFLAFPIWVLIVSIAVFRRVSAPATPTGPTEVRTAA
jgi:MFS family permease